MLMSLELRYHPCVEQRALADTFNASLGELLPLDRLHGAQQESEETWTQLDGIGLFSIALDESVGGSGLGAAEEALIAMELGHCLAAPSVLATIGATHAPSAGTASFVAGTRTAAAYRHAGRIVVVEDALATQVLLRDTDAAWLVPGRQAGELVDGGLWDSRLVHAQLVGEGVRFDPAGMRRLRLNDAAMLAGIATLALEMGVAHAGDRKQFGRPIGSFQAIKHHCANMAIAARNARDQVGFAAVAIDEGREDAHLQVDCALLVATTAALRNSATNIQIHGGIGFSEEARPHLLLKRARVLATLAGGAEAANARIAAASAAPAA